MMNEYRINKWDSGWRGGGEGKQGERWGGNRGKEGRQGSARRTVHLHGTTTSGCRASKCLCQLARQSTKHFTYLLISNTSDE